MLHILNQWKQLHSAVLTQIHKKLDQIINENLSSEKLSIKYLTDTMAMSVHLI